MLRDINGRVPFAVIGAVIMIGSAITTNFIVISQHQISGSILNDPSSNIRHLIEAAEADMKRELAYAGLYALDTVGKTPVISSDVGKYQNARDYIDEAEKNSKEKNGKIDTFEEIIEFNKNWARNLIKYRFNKYIQATFTNNRYSYGDYAINVVVDEKGNAIRSWKDINLIPVKANIKRTVDFGWLIGDKDNKYTEYWEADVKNIKIEIVNTKSGERIIKNTEIRTLIPSRLPFIMELTNFYNKSINGIMSPLNGFVTAVGMSYTEIRALMKYGSEEPSNIVANSWLQYVVNMALILVEYLVYNSVDPVSMAYLAIDAKDLMSDTVDDLSSKASSNLGNMKTSTDFSFGDISSIPDINNNYEQITEALSEKLNNNDEGKETVLKVAKGILYHPNFEYEYDDNKNLKSVEENFDENNINKSVLTKILEEVKKVYSANFNTHIKETIKNEWYSKDIHGSDWRPKSFGEWQGDKSIISGKELKIGDVPDQLPHKEVWKEEWNREETWEHLETEEDDEGNIVYKWVPHQISHHISSEYEFTLTASPHYSDISDVFKSKSYNGYDDDNMEYMLKKYIDNFFINARDDELNSPPKNEEFSKYSCSWENNSVSNCCDNSNCKTDNGGYGIDWLIGKNGEVVKELKEIVNKIEDDVEGGYYDKDIDEKYKEKYDRGINGMALLDDINKDREMLLTKFKEKEGYYLDREKYQKEGKFCSAACRVIYDIKSWFLKEIESKLSQREDAEDKINNELNSINPNLNYESIKNNMEKYKAHISSISTIQFGNKIELNGKWKENISIAISANPAYFDYRAHKKEKEKWSFSVKNKCIFSPFGLPLLPSPVTPWVVTLNTWYIEVNGKWESFRVVDSTDETIPDELFGHVGQIYQLERVEGVADISKGSNILIGECNPPSFKIQTITLAIVPPGKLGIGDLQIDEENSVS